MRTGKEKSPHAKQIQMNCFLKHEHCKGKSTRLRTRIRHVLTLQPWAGPSNLFVSQFPVHPFLLFPTPHAMPLATTNLFSISLALKKNKIQFLKVTFHLQLLENIGYIPSVYNAHNNLYPPTPPAQLGFFVPLQIPHVREIMWYLAFFDLFHLA